jgi:hypothetical protein
MIRTFIATPMIVLLVAAAVLTLHAPEASAGSCAQSISGGATLGGFFGAVNGHCESGPGTPTLPAGAPPPPTQVVDCGATPAASSLPECRSVGVDCTVAAATAVVGTVITAIVTYVQTNGVWSL